VSEFDISELCRELEKTKKERDELRLALIKIVNHWSDLHPKDRQQARTALGWPMLLSEEGER
jgi:hypothetical protein